MMLLCCLVEKVYFIEGVVEYSWNVVGIKRPIDAIPCAFVKF